MDQGKHTPNKGKWNQITEKERYKIEVLYDTTLKTLTHPLTMLCE